MLPLNGYSPLNAQATWIHRSLFHMMLLPVSVHGRVSDIWRSYILERAAHARSQRIVVHSACVVQDRNAHSYMRDFMAERPLYAQAGELIRVLAETTNEELADAPLEVLYTTLYEHGFIEEADLLLARAWMSDLVRLGVLPPQIPTSVGDGTAKSHVVAPNTTRPPANALCYLGEPRSLPRTVDTLRRNVHDVLDVEAFGEFPQTKLPLDMLAHLGPWGRIRLNADNDIKQWLVSHNVNLPVLTNNGKRWDDWLSGLTRMDGGAVFIWRGLQECMNMINEREEERGSKYGLVVFSRTDLYFPKALAIPELNSTQCWIPCPCNDWSGVCDQFAVCGRAAAVVYADVLGSIRKRIASFAAGKDPFGNGWLPWPPNAEAFLKRRLNDAKVEVLRGPDVFVRTCQCEATATSCQPHLRPPSCEYNPTHKIWFRAMERCPANGNLTDAALH